jgi:hypothetical protein
MADEPLDLDSRRGMAAQKATDLRGALAEVDTHAMELRERRAAIEDHLLSFVAASWPEAADKARYVLKLYAAGLPPEDTRHRDLIAAILADLTGSRSRAEGL